MKPLLISTMGTTKNVMPKDGKAFSLAELQGFVGGSIQLITLPNGLQLWINDNGKLDDLPMNHTASLIWQVIYYGYEIGADDYVVGDCLICEPKWTAEEEETA